MIIHYQMKYSLETRERYEASLNCDQKDVFEDGENAGWSMIDIKFGE
jgi:hypothetical protein